MLSEYQKKLRKTSQMSSVYAGFSDSVDSSIRGLRYHFRDRVSLRQIDAPQKQRQFLVTQYDLRYRNVGSRPAKFPSI